MRLRRFGLGIAILVFLVGICELTCRVAVPDHIGGEIVDGNRHVSIPWDSEIHPYFGFGNPTGFAFLDHDSPEQSDPNGVVVAVAGGSVSHMMYLDSRETLRTRLTALPYFQGKHLYVIRLGSGAWKQPQQLLSVAYYIAMGGKLDVLIELDGRNEITDVNFNVEHGIFPAYPLLWHHIALNALTPARARLVGKLTLLRDARGWLVANFRKWQWSRTAGLFWKAMDLALERLAHSQQQRLAEVEKSETVTAPRYRSGPRRQFRNRGELNRHAAGIWKQSSIALAHLAAGSGALYFQFLQPSQYIAGSKTLTPEEKRVAIDPKESYEREGYPYLREAARDFRKRGVVYFDLTGIFKDSAQTLYVDSCCHVNKAGSDLLAQGIAEKIGGVLARYASSR